MAVVAFMAVVAMVTILVFDCTILGYGGGNYGSGSYGYNTCI